MTPKIYAVTAASGRIGTRVTHQLLEAGHEVRALGRDAGRLKDLTERGARPFVGDIADPRFVERAFAGAHAAFLVVNAEHDAPDYGAAYRRIGASYAQAAAATGLRNALFVSSLGAHDPTLHGLIGIHREVEEILDRVPGLHTFHLRAGSFFDNLFYFLPGMRAAGALATPIAPEAPVDWASVEDLAQLAVRTLLELPFGRSRRVEARGATPVRMAEISEMIASAMGRPFPAVHVERAANLEGLRQAGLGADFAERMQVTWEIFSRQRVLAAATPGADTVLLPATLASFIREAFIPALTAPPARKRVRIEYQLRDDVDLAGYERALAGFVAGIRAHRADSVYTAYQHADAPRRFVHLGDFALEALPSLQAQDFFVRFTRTLREQSVAAPAVQVLQELASTRDGAR